MIYKKILILTLLFSSIVAEYPQFVPLKNLFSDPDLGLSIQQQKMVNTLITTINQSSLYEQCKAAEEVIHQLAIEIEKRRIMYENASEQDWPFIAYKAGILIAQQDTLKKFLKKTKHRLSLSQQATGACRRYVKQLAHKTSQLIKKQPPAQSLAQLLLDYTRLEREYIFTTYRSVVALVVAHEHNNLPELMAFWKNKEKRHTLLTESKKFLHQPKIQMGVGEEAVDMVVEEAAVEIGGEDTAGAESLATGINSPTKAAEEEVIQRSEAAIQATDNLNNVNNMGNEINKAAANVTPADDAAGEFSQLVEEMPKNALQKLASDLAAGLAPEDLAVTSDALDAAESTLEELTNISKRLTGRNSFQKLFGLQKVTDANLEYLSEAVNEGIGAQAVKLQMTQVRAEAARILSDESTDSATQSVFRWLRGGAKKIAQKGLRALNKTLGQQLEDATGVLVKGEELETGVEGATSEALKELQSEVQALRAQLTQPLTLSSKISRFVGDMDKAFAKKFPILHSLVHMTLFMDASMGGQLAISWEDQAQAMEYISLSQKRTEISANLQAQIAKIQTTTEASSRQLKANTINAISQAHTIQKEIELGTSQQLNYVMQSIAAETFQELYFSDAIQYDQYFYYGAMLTPNEETPLFATEQNINPGWVLYKQTPPIINLSKAGWVLYTGNPQGITPLGTGEWALSGQASSQIQTSSSPTKQRLVFPEYPTNAVAHTWYNIFRAGNWIFNPNENAFIQYETNSITSDSAPQGDYNTTLLNSIFTDYIPPIILNNEGIPTYVIQVEMTINSAQPPFFAGMFFNGGRWISGAQDLIKQHRLFGFYGDANQNISAYATETAYAVDTNQLNATTSFTALEQVFASATTKQTWKNIQHALIPNPVYPSSNSTSTPLEIGKTYILTAATQPTQIIISLDEKTATGATPLLEPLIIPNRNPFVFIYHNIGFISGGCSTTFKLLQPKQLVYSAEALQKFKEKIISAPMPQGETS